MKKLSLISRVIKWLAFALAVVAFCMMFATQLQIITTVGSGSFQITNTADVSYQDALFNASDVYKSSTIGLVGYILMGAGGLIIGLVGLISKKKMNNVVSLLTALGVVSIIVGAIFLFIYPNDFYKLNKNYIISLGYVTSSVKASATTIVAAILGICAAVTGFISVLFQTRKK